MKQFMLLIYEGVRVSTESETSGEQTLRHMAKWIDELSITGNFISAEGLDAEARGVTLQETNTSSFNSHEKISMYLLISARSIDQAVSIAAECPSLEVSVKRIEVRPLLNTARSGFIE